MIPVLALTALVLTVADAPPVSAAPRPESVMAADRYADNACVQCHRAQGGRLAQIVDEEWARSVHFEENTACQDCHGGDASLSRDDFGSEEEFKEASHLSFNAEFLFLRDRWDAVEGPRRDTVGHYACRECHTWTTERRLGDPHAGRELSACPFLRYGGVNMPRERGITYICAKCHTRAAEKHLGSTHGSRGAPSCLFCHGDNSHAIPHATIDVIDTRPREEFGKCSICHQPGTVNAVIQIRETLEETARLIETSAAQYRDLQEMGYRNLALGEMHNHVDEIQSNLRQVLHGSNIREINELARSIKNVAKYTAYDHELVQALHDAQRRQTRVAIGTVGLLLLLVAMLVLYAKAFCKPTNQPPASSPTS
ncbi:MAG: hypothetical protein KJ749_02110 [Planctomycetes bacterium]|nr:hypothetical protein [Planctomycetota bacterium]